MKNPATQYEASCAIQQAPEAHTGIEWSNWALVFIGIVGIGYAGRTLSAIKRQIDTFVSKERGRLTVEVDSFEMGAPHEVWNATLIVANHGSTNTFINTALCLPCVEYCQWNSELAEIHLSVHLPRVIEPNMRGVRFPGPVQQGDRLTIDTWDMTQETIDAIKSGEKALFMLGFIEYEDVFGSTWKLRFSRRWQGPFTQGTTLWISEWGDHGPPEANREYKIVRPSSFRRLGRWILRREPNTVMVRRAN